MDPFVHDTLEMSTAFHEDTGCYSPSWGGFYVALMVLACGVAFIRRFGGARRIFALAAAACLFVAISDMLPQPIDRLGAYAPFGLVGLILLTLNSVVYWPVKPGWINARLVYGCEAVSMLVLGWMTVHLTYF